jgi:hypothetical protein
MGNGSKIVHECILAVYGDAASLKCKIKYWSKQSNWGSEPSQHEAGSKLKVMFLLNIG